jgi:hypothetical protein
VKKHEEFLTTRKEGDWKKRSFLLTCPLINIDAPSFSGSGAAAFYSLVFSLLERLRI